MNLPALFIEDFRNDATQSDFIQQTKGESEPSWLESIKNRIYERNGVAQCRELTGIVSEGAACSSGLSQAMINGLLKKAGIGVLGDMLASCSV